MRSCPHLLATVLAILAILAMVVAARTLPACSGGSTRPGSIQILAAQDPATGRFIVSEAPAGLAGARAGLEAGDEIVAIDGRPTAGLTRRGFREAVRGEIGTHVILTVRRNGALMNFEVERGPLK